MSEKIKVIIRKIERNIPIYGDQLSSEEGAIIYMALSYQEDKERFLDDVWCQYHTINELEKELAGGCYD